jgi:signal transduction histidine kinase
MNKPASVGFRNLPFAVADLALNGIELAVRLHGLHDHWEASSIARRARMLFDLRHSTRVLLNLISNGFYAATKRKAEAGDGFEPTLVAATKSLGDKVEIRIRDNGTGIPEGVKDKIFNPFFTTKPTGEGTGLGLSMNHDIIVKQHVGSIDVETKSGIFTEFKIVLPRTSQR